MASSEELFGGMTVKDGILYDKDDKEISRDPAIIQGIRTASEAAKNQQAAVQAIQAVKVKEEQESSEVTANAIKAMVDLKETYAKAGLANANIDYALQGLIQNSNVQLATPSRQELMQAAAKFANPNNNNAAANGNGQRSVSAKIVSRIPKFSGSDENYSWDQFLTQLHIASANENYSDREMLHIFLHTLEGQALDHYRAFQDTYDNYTYDQIIAAFKDRYGQDEHLGVNNLVGITQGNDETVMAFQDRIINASKALQPRPPPLYRVMKIPGKPDELIQNVTYNLEKVHYNALIEQNLKYQSTFFLQGLRPEIKTQMKSSKFTTLADAAKAAREAEDHLKISGMVNAVHNLNIKEKVNFTTSNPLQEMDRRGASGPKEGIDKSNLRCFGCQKKGHFKRDCPLQRRNRKNFKRDMSHERNSYNRNRSFSRGRSFSRERGSNRNQGEEIDELTNNLKDMTLRLHAMRGSRNSSRDRRGRQFSRSHSRNGRFRRRSGSQSFSRSHSRNRSNSRGYDRSRSFSKNRY